MREILFRGKRKDNGEWFYGDLLQIPTHNFCSVIEQTACAENKEVIPETVGQYTGLTDKNGKKIFEGDILKMERDIQCSEKTKKREITVGVVWFDTKSAEFGYKSAGHYRCLTLKRWTGDTQEVIGNIHDNPEFLEVQ